MLPAPTSERCMRERERERERDTLILLPNGFSWGIHHPLQRRQWENEEKETERSRERVREWKREREREEVNPKHLAFQSLIPTVDGFHLTAQHRCTEVRIWIMWRLCFHAVTVLLHTSWKWASYNQCWVSVCFSYGSIVFRGSVCLCDKPHSVWCCDNLWTSEVVSEY